MNILICGFMGAGKTTLLESFKKDSSRYSLFDLDREVAEALSISPLEIGAWIEGSGLVEFRKKEILVLKELLALKSSKVIALGGGTLEAPGFWELVSAGCHLVFLDTPLDLCLERIKGDSNRPLAKKSEEELRLLYQKRLEHYLRSDLILAENVVGLDSLVHNLLKKV